MKKVLTSLLLVVIFSLNSFGWGATGHRVTGHIASKYLNKKARKTIELLLKGQSLAIASTWMDEVRADSTFRYMNDWHWVTIPYGQTYEQTQKNKNGDIILTLNKIIAELKSKKLSEAEQVERIKILIHLVGDIHQPLHVGGKSDRGGNQVKVLWQGTDSDLHSVWDSEIIDDTKLSYTELAESLDAPTLSEVKTWQRTSILDWAKESQSYAEQVYNTGNGKLGFRYAYVCYPIIRHRLLQAGVRLAGILNDVYGK